MSSWEDFLKHRKEKQKEQDLNTAKFLYKNQTIDDAFINSYFSDTKKLLEDNSNAYTSADYNSLSDFRESVNNFKNNQLSLKYKKVLIDDFLAKVPDSANKTEILKALNDNNDSVNKMAGMFDELYSQIDNEPKNFYSYKFGNKASFDVIQAEINKLVERKSSEEGSDAKETQEEIDVLENLKYTLNYQTVEDYDKAINAAEEQLEKLYKESPTNRGLVGGSIYRDNSAEKTVLENQIARLKENKELAAYCEIPNKLGDKNLEFFVAQHKQNITNPTPDEINAWFEGSNQSAETIPQINDPLGFVFDNPDLYGQYNATSDIGAMVLELYDDAQNHHWNQITDKEKQIYYYTLGTKGKEEALNYLKLLEPEFGKRYRGEVSNAFSKFYDEQGVLAYLGLNLLSFPMQAIGGVMAFVDNTADYITKGEINPYSSLNNFRIGAETIRSETANAIEGSTSWEIGGKNVLSQLYSFGMSYADSMLGGRLIGPAYAFVLGSGAAASTAEDYYNRGATPGQIFSASFAAGLTETITEYIPLNKMFGEGKEAVTSLRKGIKNALSNAMTEASEEFITEITNKVVDSLVMQDKSAINERLTELINNGMSEEEAQKTVTQEVMSDINWAFAGGFLTGGVGGTSASVISGLSNFQYANYLTQTGKEIQKTGDVQNLIDYAKAMNSEKVNDLFEGMSSKPSANQIGELYQAVVEQTRNDMSKSSDYNNLAKYIESKANSTPSQNIKNLLGVEYFNTMQNTYWKDGTNMWDGLRVNTALGAKGENPVVSNVRQYTSGDDFVMGNYTDPTAQTVDTSNRQVQVDIGVDGNGENGYNDIRGEDYADYNGQRVDGFSQTTGRYSGTDSRGESQVGKERGGTQENDIRGTQSNTYEGRRGERVHVKIGNKSISYVPKEPDNSVGGNAVRVLNSIGVKAILCDGDIISESASHPSYSEALTMPDGTVYVSSNATLSDIEIAAHEAVHSYDRKDSKAYKKYYQTILDEFAWNKNSYRKMANFINKNHYNGKYDIYSSVFEKLFIREISAYVNQYVATNEQKATELFSGLFTNWDAVVEASRQFNKDIGADFSESASFMPEGESVLPHVSAQGPEADPIKDWAFKERGVERLTDDQKFIKRVGKAFGREVVFDNLDKWVTDENGKRVLFSPNGKYDKNTGKIYINSSKNATGNALAFIFKHELTHFAETAGDAFTDFMNGIMDSQAFKNWVRSKEYADSDTVSATMAMNAKYIERWKFTGKDAEHKANIEMAADFVGENLFVKDLTKLEQAINELKPKEIRNFKEWILNILDKLKSVFQKRGFDSIDKIEREFVRICDRAMKAAEQKTVDKAKNSTDEGGERYSLLVASADVLDLVQKVKTGDFKANEKVYFENVSDELASKIESLTGINVKGFKVAIEARQIEHILKDHGENGKSDHSMSSDEDIAKMQYVLKKPDDLSLSGKTQAYSYMKNGYNKTADTVLYEKAIGNKSYYVVQAIPDTKAKTLYVVSAFIGEKGHKKETSQLINAKSPDATAKSGSVVVSNNSIDQNDQSVNSYSMQQSEDYSEYDGEKFSFAGKRATTADNSRLLRAKQMLENGVNEEEIRQVTGWFKGYDGKWRFEIDDSEMQVDPNGKIIKSEVVEDSMSVMKNENRQQAATSVKNVVNSVGHLEDYIRHKKLFEAYPELKRVEFNYSLFFDGTTGTYDPVTKSITVDFRLRKDVGELKKVLIHEIQHAIQDIEDFTLGTNYAYWENVISTANVQHQKYQQEADKYMRQLRDKLGDDFVMEVYDIAEDLSRSVYAETEAKVTALEDKARRKGCKRLYNKAVYALLRLSSVERVISKLGGRSAEELYFATAGEVEARDSANRWWRSDEARKEMRPDIDRTDVVFADDNVSYSVSNGVDTYTEEQYNNFGWVRYNDILSASEYNTLLSRYADYKHNKYKYPTTRFGEAVIHSSECPDVIMYVKGPIRSPQITKVIRIKHNESWATPFIKEEILNNEHQRNYQPFKTVEDYFGYGVLSIAKARDNVSFREYRAETKRSSGQTSNTFGGIEQNGAGSTKQNTETDRADLNESASFMPENEQYSVGLTDTEEFDTNKFSGELLNKYGESGLSQKKITDLLDSVFYSVLNSQWSEAFADVQTIAVSFTNADTKQITDHILDVVNKAYDKASDFAKEQVAGSKAADISEENKRLKVTLDSAKERIRTLEAQNKETETVSDKRKNKENPISIARLKPSAANTTPFVEKQTSNAPGNKRSNFYENMQGSSIFDERFKEDMKSDDYIKTYNSTTNKETLRKAVKALETGGQQYVTEWFQKPTDEASLLDITVGLLLIDRYQRVGNTEGAIATAQRVREMGTASGQQVQIFSIIGRFDPNTMAAYAQKELSTAYEALVKGKTNKWVEANKKKFELTPDEIESIRRRTLQAAMLPECRQKAVLLAEIVSLLQNKIPPESGQSIRAWQRISMLLNVKTNVRNIVGNLGMVPVYIGSDYFGTIIDKAVAKKTNVRTTGISDPLTNALTKSGREQLKKTAKGFGKGLYESFDDFKRGIHTKQEELNRYAVEGFDAYRATGDIKQSIKKREGVAQGGKNFNENTEYKAINAIARKLNALDNLTSFCLEVGDRPFFEMWFMNSLNNQLRLNKTTEPTPNMIDIATQDALQRTWQDESKMAKMVANLKKNANAFHLPGTTYGLGDFIFKFTKTPANIAKAIVDFSPIGLVSAAYKAYDMKNAIETAQFTPQMQRDFVKTASNAITGTVIYALVIIGASLGFVEFSGAGDDDKDAANFEKYIAGIPPYSIELFGTNVTYDWLQPFGSTLAISAAYMENRNDPETSWDKDILDAFVSAGTVFTEQSFLKSLNEFFKAVEADGNIFMGLLDMAISDPSVNIPTLFSQVGSFLDEDRRSTYDATSDFKTMLNGLMSKIPGVRKLLPEQVDVLGEDVENNQYLDPWRAFGSPYNEYPESAGEVANEIYDLYKATGDKTVIPRVAPNSITVKGRKYSFDTAEKAEYQRSIGKSSAEMLEILFKQKSDYGLNEKQLVDVINKIYNYAAKLAKVDVISKDYDYELISAMVGTDKNGNPILSKEKYNALTKEAKLHIIQETLLTKAEMKFKTPEDAVKYYIKQAKD